jgi:hypothetical protein
MGAQIKLKMEDYAPDTGRKGSYALLMDAQIKLSEEGCA